MDRLKNNSLLLPVGAALLLGFVGAAIKAASPFHRLANGLFFGGGAALLVGLVRLVRRLGTGDVFAFSHLRVSQSIRRDTLRRSGKEVSEEDIPSGQQVDNYYDYLQQKSPGRPWAPALALGLALMGLSFLCAWAG